MAQAAIRQAKKKKSEEGSRATAPATASPDVAGKKPLVCAVCGAVITSDEARVERGGAHVHERFNPSQVTFEFGCFSEAPGARAEGEPTTFFSWFHGFAWRVAGCSRCGAHLGWRFEREGDAFWGLILERLARPD